MPRQLPEAALPKLFSRRTSPRFGWALRGRLTHRPSEVERPSQGRLVGNLDKAGMRSGRERPRINDGEN